MAIPDFQMLMRPLLEFATDGNIHTLAEAREHLASAFSLTQSDLEELLPSGRQRRFDNRVAWAKVYLEQAGLLESPKRGSFLITTEGKLFFPKSPTKITIGTLDQFEKFRVFRSSSKTDKEEKTTTPANQEPAETPEELLEQSFQRIQEELTASVLEQVKNCSPAFFENLVVELP